jgi:hypothetical protein
VLFLSQVLMCHSAITIYRFNARPLVYILCRNTLMIISINSQSMGVMFMSLLVDLGELAMVALKWGWW